MTSLRSVCSATIPSSSAPNVSPNWPRLIGRPITSRTGLIAPRLSRRNAAGKGLEGCREHRLAR